MTGSQQDPFLLCEYDATQYEFVREESVNVRDDSVLGLYHSTYTIKLPGICCVDMICMRMVCEEEEETKQMIKTISSCGGRCEVASVDFSGAFSVTANFASFHGESGKGGECKTPGSGGSQDCRPATFSTTCPKEFFKLNYDKQFARGVMGFGQLLRVNISIQAKAVDYVPVGGDAQGKDDCIRCLLSGFTSRLKSVCVFGCHIDRLPLGSKNLNLVNTLFHVEGYCKDQRGDPGFTGSSSLVCDCIDVGLLCGISLSRARKFVQAVECLQKVQAYLFILFQDLNKGSEFGGAHKDKVNSEKGDGVKKFLISSCQHCEGDVGKLKLNSLVEEQRESGIDMNFKKLTPGGDLSSGGGGLVALMRAKATRSLKLSLRTRFSTCSNSEDILIQMAKCQLFIADAMYQHCDFRSQMSALFKAADLYTLSEECSSYRESNRNSPVGSCLCECHSAPEDTYEKRPSDCVDGLAASIVSPLYSCTLFSGSSGIPASTKEYMKRFDPYADSKLNYAKIIDPLIKFISRCCICDAAGYESVRIMGMKTLAQVLETLGCSIGEKNFADVILVIFETHPSIEMLKARELDVNNSYLLDASMNSAFSYDSRDDSMIASGSGAMSDTGGLGTGGGIRRNGNGTESPSTKDAETNSVCRKGPPSPLVLDAYGRLFDICCGLLVHFSPDVLRSLAVNAIEPLIFSTCPPELQVQLFRMYVVSLESVKESLPPCFDLYTLMIYLMHEDDKPIMAATAQVIWDYLCKHLIRSIDIRRDFETFANWVDFILGSWPTLPDGSKAIPLSDRAGVRRIVSGLNSSKAPVMAELVIKLIQDVFTDCRIKCVIQNYMATFKSTQNHSTNVKQFENSYSHILSTVRLVVCNQMKVLAEFCGNIDATPNKLFRLLVVLVRVELYLNR